MTKLITKKVETVLSWVGIGSYLTALGILVWYAEEDVERVVVMIWCLLGICGCLGFWNTVIQEMQRTHTDTLMHLLKQQKAINAAVIALLKDSNDQVRAEIAQQKVDLEQLEDPESETK